jgi:hypothetical protein
VGLLTSLGLVALGIVPSAASAAIGSIQGTVTHGATPIQNMRVCAIQKGKAGATECATTTAEGKYALLLAEGEYFLSFTGYVCPGGEQRCRKEYVPQYNGGKAKQTEATALHVGTVTEDANMTKGATVRGTVTTSSKGTPIANVEVCAFIGSPTEVEGFIEFVESLTCAFTGASGEYALEGLTNGKSYTVGVDTGEVCGTTEKSPCTFLYEPQVYNNQQSFETANKVTVEEVSPQTGINFSLIPLPPVNKEKPQLSGAATRGGAMQCSQGTWEAGIAEATVVGFGYAWLRNGVPIPGQAANAYTLQAADEGQAISCTVTATASNENASASATSNAVIVPFTPSTTTTTTTTTSSTRATGNAVAGAKAPVKAGKAALTLSCEGAGECTGTVSLTVSVIETHVVKRHGKRHAVKRTRKLVIGTASFTIAAGGKVTLSVTLTRQGQRLVGSARGGVQTQVSGSDVRSGRVVLQQTATHKTRHTSRGRR